MDKFCAIVPDRGDRPELMSFCRHQLERMTVKPDKVYFIDYPPKNNRKDLVPRIKKGIELAKADGFEYCYIVESDDWYPSDYFEKFSFGDAHFIGCERTACYNLRNNTWEVISHIQRSSLFNTGFSIKALEGFRFPDDDQIFLDLRIWKYAVKSRHFAIKMHNQYPISIKHNIGLVGGKGHRITYANSDPDRSYLKSIVDSEAYAFYQTLKV